MDSASWIMNHDALTDIMESTETSTGPEERPMTSPVHKTPRRLRRRRSQQSPATSVLSLSPSLAPPPPAHLGFTVTRRLPSLSSIRHAAAKQEPISSDSLWRPPPRTFVRPAAPLDILDTPRILNALVDLHLQASSPIFMGGGTVEGSMTLRIGQKPRSNAMDGIETSLLSISVDVIGFEQSLRNRRSVFLSLATELVDADHPPPLSILDRSADLGFTHRKQHWPIIPSTSTLPFQLHLPLDVGPGSFVSKQASIRYLLCITVLISDAGRQQLIRESIDIDLLSAFDPEKALVSLPSPLTAVDEYIIDRGGVSETIRVTAGVHRQTWISGTTAFVDVYVRNYTGKTIRKIVIQVERTIILYEHVTTPKASEHSLMLMGSCGHKSPATTLEASAVHLRLSKNNNIKVISKNVIKTSSKSGWNGVASHSSGQLTGEIDIPRGHITVRPGRYFEVRYHLNVSVCSTFSTFVTVQLPVTIIHMNSLDIVPNSLNQVAFAIEQKRGRSSRRGHSANGPGAVQARAFSAARRQALEQLRAQTLTPAEIEALTRDLETSPRKTPKSRTNAAEYPISGRSSSIGRMMDIRRKFTRKPSGPRLQQSTSGLLFTDSDESEEPDGGPTGIRRPAEGISKKRTFDRPTAFREEF
ncbi:MAG: hypothetical protein M1833_000547 [Piccolia ochrophora]|nr:MAG: hypothetical protein M1833_000547 [Piccolia ochrophora]